MGLYYNTTRGPVTFETRNGASAAVPGKSWCSVPKEQEASSSLMRLVRAGILVRRDDPAESAAAALTHERVAPADSVRVEPIVPQVDTSAVVVDEHTVVASVEPGDSEAPSADGAGTAEARRTEKRSRRGK